jgi:hypothetical protein
MGRKAKMEQITRIELIDQDGRVFTKYYDTPITYKTDLQDDGQTLKIFVEES